MITGLPFTSVTVSRLGGVRLSDKGPALNLDIIPRGLDVEGCNARLELVWGKRSTKDGLAVQRLFVACKPKVGGFAKTGGIGLNDHLWAGRWGGDIATTLRAGTIGTGGRREGLDWSTPVLLSVHILINLDVLEYALLVDGKLNRLLGNIRILGGIGAVLDGNTNPLGTGLAGMEHVLLALELSKVRVIPDAQLDLISGTVLELGVLDRGRAMLAVNVPPLIDGRDLTLDGLDNRPGGEVFDFWYGVHDRTKEGRYGCYDCKDYYAISFVVMESRER